MSIMQCNLPVSIKYHHLLLIAFSVKAVNLIWRNNYQTSNYYLGLKRGIILSLSQPTFSLPIAPNTSVHNASIHILQSQHTTHNHIILFPATSQSTHPLLDIFPEEKTNIIIQQAKILKSICGRNTDCNITTIDFPITPSFRVLSRTLSVVLTLRDAGKVSFT